MAARKRKPATRSQTPTDGPAAQPADASPRAPGALPDAGKLRPWLLGALCALFVARPLYPSEGAVWQGDGLPVVMLWIAIAAIWLLGAIGRRSFCLRMQCTDAAVLTLVAWHTLAAVGAITHASPRPAVNSLWEWIGLALAYLLARQWIETPREARAVAAVMVALAVALAGYGLYQYFHELPAMRAAFEADREGALRDAGLDFAPGSTEMRLFEDRVGSVEPFATFALTNSLAGYLAPWLVVLGGIVALGTPSRPGRGARFTLAFAGLVAVGLAVAACLVLTKSRSAFLATGVGLTMLWLFSGQWFRRLGWKLPLGAVVVVAVLLGGAAVVGGLDREVFSEASKSLGYRFQYWQGSLRMIADRPAFGCGPGNFQNAYTAYRLPEAGEEVADPHNFLLEVWATAGTPAMVAMLAVLACFFLRTSRLPTVPDSRPSPAESAKGNPFSADASPPARKVPATDSPIAVYLGAGCGFLLSFALGLISAAPPGAMAVLLGLPLAAGCLTLLAGWVDRGQMPPWLPAVGAAVLLVNLLAAGGIGFPGVAGSFWLLVALGLNHRQVDAPAKTVPRGVAVGLLAGVCILGVACFSTGYGPVLRCQGNLRAARAALQLADLNKGRDLLLAAQEADPLAVDPWQQLAALTLARAQHEPGPQTRAALEQVLEQYAPALDRLAPNSSRAWFEAGKTLQQAHALTGKPEWAEQAVVAFERAVELYPNSATCRGWLALAYRTAGDVDAFRREADRALQLDQQTPHSNQKLDDEVRAELLPPGNH